MGQRPEREPTRKCIIERGRADASVGLQIGSVWMATTFSKRNKERARQEKQKDKALDRQQRKQARQDKPPPEPGVDPDIAHIIPGPQPIEIEEEML
jgi:hypothetical protein